MLTRLKVSTLLGLASVYTLAITMSAQRPQAAATIPASESAGYATLTEAELRTDLSYIASDKLQGRLSLQPGDEEATQWVAEQFRKAGLQPAVTDAAGKPSYLQPFTLVEYRADRAASTVTLTRAGQPTVFHAPQAFGAYKAPVDVTAPVVFAGFGITAPELGYDDYKGLDARGKIVLLFDHEPQEDDPHSIFNGTGNTRYATTRVKLLNAQKHGAVAVVIVAEPNRKHLTNAERSARIGGSNARTQPLPLQAIQDDEISIPSVLILDAVAAQLFATTGTTGSAPETILISAHHDHDGAAPCPADAGGVDQDGKSTAAGADCLQIWHGADDNGSGTVGVVALAREFAANPVKPKRSILFVVFASEERGLLGSYWMAAHPLRPLATTRAMINFDMIGRDEKPSPQTDGLIAIPADTSNRLNLIGALYSPSYNKVVTEENKRVGLVLDDRFDHESALNVFFRSDQFPFVLHDVPAFWWFTGFHPDYHHITDTVEKIDFAKMKRILDLAYLTGFRFADDAHTPVFIPNPEPAR